MPLPFPKKRRSLTETESPYDPTKYDKHDVLALTSARDLYRARRHPDDAVTQQRSGLDPRLFVTGLEKVGSDDDGHRKVTRIATSFARTSACFALLPIKPEPSTGAFSCYLVNESFFDKDAREVPPVNVTVDQQSWRLKPKRAERASPPFLPGGPAIKVALARGDKGFVIDGALLDFVNTWTRVDWAGALPDEKKNYASVVDENPESLELVVHVPGTGAIVRIKPNTDEAAPVDERLAQELKLAMNNGALLGTVNDGSREVAFLDLAALKPGEDPWKLLLATPEGGVREFWLKADKKLEDRGFLTLLPEPEIWRSLRNGTVIGKNKLRGDEDAILLNVCSLKGDRDLSEFAQASKISGTLDFKWTPGQKLQVAFQAETGLPGLEVARRRIEAAFDAWTAATSLRVTFWPQDAQAFPTPGARGDTAAMPYYDILINLDTLPQFIPATASDPARFVDFPVSEHGTYALRRRLGAPSLFLGWLPDFKPDAATEPFVSSEHYFGSDVFLHFALHEIGHALGLPHLNQAPHARLSKLGALVNTQEVHDFFRQNHGVQIAHTFIVEELLREWPYAEDDRFNEWPAALSTIQFLKVNGIADGTVESVLKDSIMVSFPALAALSRKSPNEPLNPAAIKYRTAPTAVDLAWIKQLYP
ncbi:MAG TPA: hypothetical protein VFX59_02320 [Polyangiales bacterium]|nr:hypothetical protein [Polyangiales bacterium]